MSTQNLKPFEVNPQTPPTEWLTQDPLQLPQRGGGGVAAGNDELSGKEVGAVTAPELEVVSTVVRSVAIGLEAVSSTGIAVRDARGAEQDAAHDKSEHIHAIDVLHRFTSLSIHHWS